MEKNQIVSDAEILLEGMTSVSALLNTPPEINDRRILRVLIDRTKRRSKAAEIGYLTAKSHERGFSVAFVDPAEIDHLTSGTTHGGIAAVCTDRTIPPLCAGRIKPNGFYVYPEGMEDPYNFGNALRSLYAAGVSGVVLPPRNWMNAAGVVAKSSAGTSEKLELTVADPDTLVREFRAAGYRILSAGIRDSVSVFDEPLCYPLLLVVGGEKRGISRKILDASDAIVRVDYGREFRGSLSSSAACAVLAFEIFRQNRPSGDKKAK